MHGKHDADNEQHQAEKECEAFHAEECSTGSAGRGAESTRSSVDHAHYLLVYRRFARIKECRISSEEPPLDECADCGRAHFRSENGATSQAEGRVAFAL